MPIHDQGYRRYTGSRQPIGRSWAVITKAGIRSFLTRRALIGLLIVAWLPAVVRAVQLYAAANLPQAEFLAPTRETFRNFLGQQDPFLFFITVYVGAGLIANDRRVNALQIYLSKPITRAEYVFGKLALLMVFLLFVTWVPAVVLLFVQILFAGSFSFFLSNPTVLPAITIVAFVQTLTFAMAMLALSSLSKSGRYAGIMFAGLIFFMQAFYTVVRAVTGDSRWAWVSVDAVLTHLGDAIFRMPARYDLPVWGAALTLAAVLLGAAAVLHRQVRGVEVVT
jgi:ABC-2 type transport system permease protein